MKGLLIAGMSAWSRRSWLAAQSVFGFVFIVSLIGFVHFYLQPVGQPSSVSNFRHYSLSKEGIGSASAVDSSSGGRRDKPPITLDTLNNTIKASDHLATPTGWVYILTTASACNQQTDFSQATPYTGEQLINLLDSHHGQRFCFRSSFNGVALYAYSLSSIIDVRPPLMTTDSQYTKPRTSVTISADSASADADFSSGSYQVFNPDHNSCDAQLMSSGTSTGLEVTLTKSTYNHHRVCFSLSDYHHNLAYTASAPITGLLATATPLRDGPPVIAVQLGDGYISATDDEANTTWHYLILSHNNCNSQTDFSSASAYSEAAQLSLDYSAHGNKFYCFRSVDSDGNQAFASRLIPNRPVITALEINRTAGTYGLGRVFTIRVIFNKAIIVVPRATSRNAYLVTNARDRKSSLNEYQGFQGNQVEFYYIPVRGHDYTPNFLEVEAIALNDALTIRDTAGNDAFLVVPESVTLSSYKQIKIDARVTTVTINNPANADAWSASKSLSATDDFSSNDNLPDNGLGVNSAGQEYHVFEYFFVPAGKVDPDDLDSQTLGKRIVDHQCRLNDYRAESHSYVEGSELVLGSEANNHYLCFRSRRADANLHDLATGGDRDWTGVMSDLIHMIDGQGPVITFDYDGSRVIPTATDKNGVDDTSLRYKIVDITSDCSEQTLASGTTDYINQAPINVSDDDYYKVFCFEAADLVGNKRQVAFYPFQDSSPRQISAISSSQANGHYTIGTQMTIQVTFSGVILVNAQPSLSLNSGGRAHYVSGHNSRSLIFSYTVGPTQNSADLDVVSLDLSGGSLTGVNNNQVLLDMPASNLGHNKDLVIDTSNPVIAIGQLLNNQLSATVSDNFDDQITFEVQLITGSLCNAATGGLFLPYTSGSSISLSYPQRACWRAVDDAGNVSYSASVTAVDDQIPVITVSPSDDQPAPKQTIIVSAESPDTDLDLNSWAYKLIASDATCDLMTMTDGTTTSGSSTTLNQESHNNRKVCFSVTDQADNLGYGVSGVISGIDTTAPTIDVSAVTNNQVSATVSDNLDSAPSLSSQILASGNCDANTAGSFITYTANALLPLTPGQKACFKATDNAGNTAYAVSAVSADTTAPVITVSPSSDDETAKQTITVSASSTDTDLDPNSWAYKLIASDVTCDAQIMASSTGAGNRVVLNQEAFNHHKVCFSVADIARNFGYGVSGLITGIDVTDPLISISAIDANQISAIVTDNIDPKPEFGYTYLATGQICSDQQDFASYLAGTVLDLQVGQTICFVAVDSAGNISYAASHVGNQDLTPPLVSLELSNQNRILRARDDKQSPTLWLYRLIGSDDDQQCDTTTDFSQSFRYVENSILPLMALHHAQRFCFRSVSQAQIAGYGLSDVVDIKPPLISVTSKDNQALARDDDPNPTIWHYQLIDAGDNCSATTFNGDAKTYQEAHTLTVKTTKLRQICFRSVDLQANDSYAVSDILTTTQPPQPRPQPQPQPEPEPEPQPQPQPEPQLQPPRDSVGVDDELPQTDNDLPTWLLVGVLVLNAVLLLFVIFLFWRRRQEESDNRIDSD